MTDVKKFQNKGKFKIVKGSILTPEYAGLRLILNTINSKGLVNSELLPIFDKKWKKIKEESKGWYASRNNFKGGENLNIAVQSDTWVINCLCQDDDYVINVKDLESSLKKVASLAKAEKASVHVPDLLINSCPQLSDMLQDLFINDGINVSVYSD